MGLTKQEKEIHLIPNDVPYVPLDATDAFNGLEEKHKLYAYYISKASWEGSKACLFHTSYESPAIFLLLQQVFTQPIAELKKSAMKNNVPENEFLAFTTYAASFFCNMGNYKSFGDTKFIPDMTKHNFRTIVESSTGYASDSSYTKALLLDTIDFIFSLDANVKQLGFRPEAYTAFYSQNVTQADTELIQRYMESRKYAPWNSRVFKTVTGKGAPLFEIRLAASDEVVLQETESFEDAEFRVVSGDYSPMMKRAIENLRKATEFASSEDQIKMLENYCLSFQTGSIDAHKDGSRHWIRDKGPIVESYIGFIETYRDPLGVRAEWEGFVAVVNKEQSKKFNTLVENAELLLTKLPWSKDLEKDTFLRPDFTSLDVVAYGSTGVPAGINIPNYDDIRQDEGFKNVSLGNVLAANTKVKSVTFLSQEDEELYKKYAGPAFAVQVGLHELLGHGSGKLFREDEAGQFNFDKKNVEIPSFDSETMENVSVQSWYKPSETYDSKFPVFGSSYEECRAESVGIYLCLEKEAMAVFGHTEDQEIEDVIYTNWLMMARAGLTALEFYRPEKGSWGQAHMQARFAILQVMLEAGNDFVKIEAVTVKKNRTSLKTLRVSMDRSKILTIGKEAIGKFLLKLQVFKATGDYQAAKDMYNKYTSVSDEFLTFRDLVISNKQPRKILVQPELVLSDDMKSVSIETFDASAEGMIMAFQKRFPSKDSELYEFWKNTQPFMKIN